MDGDIDAWARDQFWDYNSLLFLCATVWKISISFFPSNNKPSETLGVAKIR